MLPSTTEIRAHHADKTEQCTILNDNSALNFKQNFEMSRKGFYGNQIASALIHTSLALCFEFPNKSLQKWQCFWQ